MKETRKKERKKKNSFYILCKLSLKVFNVCLFTMFIFQ